MSTERQILHFAPVPVRYRYDGWTPDKQIAFVEALAVGATVEEAARHVGMSVTSANNLRNRADAHHFREAWDAAQDTTMAQLEHAAGQRCIHGVPRPVFYKGEQVGEWRHFDERLTMFMLRNRRRARYGAWQDRSGPPIDLDDPGADVEDDSAGRLAAHCDEIAAIEYADGEDGLEDAELAPNDGTAEEPFVAEDAPPASARVDATTSTTSADAPPSPGPL
ncbi:MAG: hypothetical protein ABIQ32_05445 [Sphingomicrobium sp.]